VNCRPGRHLLGATMALALLASARPARADVSSWVYVGGGASMLEDAETDRRVRATLSTYAGLGSPPDGIVSVGGLLLVQPHFGEGIDLGLLARVATYGYTNGGFGVALDLGGYQRWWGVGSTGGIGTLSLGIPWGITLNVQALRGTNESSTYAATLGLDFARLTVYRTSGNQWWENPFPAVREERPRY
jgi:hypothetical protein